MILILTPIDIDIKREKYCRFRKTDSNLLITKIQTIYCIWLMSKGKYFLED